MCKSLIRCGFALVGTLGATVGAWAGPVEFNREVRPIISDNCFSCHGPDEAARKRGLRFDTEEGLFSKTKEGFPILVPGEPGESELFLRITDPDPDERMPPKDSHLSLTDDEIATVKAWIEQGAEWQGHWSFIPPVRRPLPEVEQEDWVRNPMSAEKRLLP